jgi:hypothetical protein
VRIKEERTDFYLLILIWGHFWRKLEIMVPFHDSTSNGRNVPDATGVLDPGVNTLRIIHGLLDPRQYNELVNADQASPRALQHLL